MQHGMYGLHMGKGGVENIEMVAGLSYNDFFRQKHVSSASSALKTL